MATPMTTTQLIRQLQKWGVKYGAYKSWTTHNRNHMGKWGPVHGLAWHHTGSDSKDQRELLYNGTAELPGPLCHFGIAQDGTVWLIGWGRTNHAGLGDDDVLDALIAERDLPVDDESNTDGNARLYGIEFWYSGSHPMTDEQYFSGVRLSCAIYDFHNWGANSTLAHGEWQPGKWDPGYAPGKMMNMDNVRKDIAEALAKGPVLPTNPTPPNKPQVYKDVWESDVAAPPRGHATDANPFWVPLSLLRHACEQAELARKNTEKIMKHLNIQ